MIGNLLIGLREGLEAALVVSILVAYVVKTDRRRLLPSIWTGVAIAIAVSIGAGAALTLVSEELSDTLAETLAGVLSILAVGLVTWMIFWMATAGRRLSGELRGRIDAAEGNPWALVVVAFLAVAREGIETALFLWAATRAAADGSSSVEPLLGALAGIAIAIVLGWLIYRGVISINLSKFFTVTGWFLILVAAGVLAYGVHELQEASVLPGEDDLAFDLTGVVAPTSLPAVLLRGVLNLRPAMSVLEVGGWIGYVAIVGGLFWVRTRTKAGPRPAVADERAPEPSGKR